MRRMTPLLAALAALLVLGACSSAPELRPVMTVGGLPAEDADAALSNGLKHLRAGRPGLAAHALQVAVARDPGNIRALNALGVAYDRLGRFDLADRTYRRALALDPSHPLVLNNKGWSYYLRGRDRLAAFYLQRARAAAPDEARIAANLEAVQAQRQRQAAQGRREAAVMRLDRGIGPKLRRLSLREHRLELPTQAVAMAQRRHAPPAVPPNLVIEVSNGTGRPRMAARMARHLRGRSPAAIRLSNADHFGHRRSMVLYRPGHEAAARALAARLPAGIPVRRADGQAAPLRLLLGADLLAFDRALWKAALHNDEEEA